jgi:RimJ/RimL family protein N-acetyltransferase
MRYTTTYVPGGFYELNPFPGCNQIVVSNHAFIPKEHRGKGLGSMAHKHRLEHIKQLGYDYVMCTVHENNEPQIKILENNGWTYLDFFLNKETSKLLRIYGKRINA